MNESNALVVRQPLTPDTWSMIQAVAPVVHGSRVFGVSSPAQAAAIMLKGRELGLELMASFEFIQAVEGRVGLSPRGALAIIQSSPLCAGLKIEDIADANGKPQSCRVWMKRSNGFEFTVQWSMADAEAAGVVKKGSGWDKYPANMLRWRAVGFCADVVFPDVIGGMKRADELGADLTPSGDVIEGSWRAVESTPVQVAPPAPTPAPDPVAAALNDAVERFGAEAVMAANGGAIPETVDEIAAIVARLVNETDIEV